MNQRNSQRKYCEILKYTEKYCKILQYLNILKSINLTGYTQNVNELYDIWNELKEDEIIADSAQGNVNKGDVT